TLRFAWHLTSLAWWSFAALLLVYGARGVREPETAALTVIAVTFLISAIVACVGSRGRHYAWIVFLLIAVAVWLGID
ncbi:MAG TPA: hypothetical protein VOA87_23070, partial [Thermoanaerobaculia bacterium]|nr:hypothetical protein [Thermoanaerobaculia bacterium]